MEFKDFFQWIFFSLVSGVVIYFTTTLKETLKGLKDSIDSLNQKMAVEIEKSNWIRKNIEDVQNEITSHENRLRDVEFKITKARL